MTLRWKYRHPSIKSQSRMKGQLGALVSWWQENQILAFLASLRFPNLKPSLSVLEKYQAIAAQRRILTSLTLLLLCTTLLQAQVTIYKTKEKPTNPKQFDWHYDAKTLTTSVYLDSAWKIIFTNQRVKLEADGQRFVVVNRLDENIVDLYNREGKPLQLYEIGVEVYDCIYVWNPFDNYAVFDDQGEVLTYVNRYQIEFPEPEKVNGQLAFCLPKPTGELYRVDQSEWHTWGMLGTNGKWIIEPKFDAPFHFQNGFADVMYYGLKRRIDFTGAFVDGN